VVDVRDINDEDIKVEPLSRGLRSDGFSTMMTPAISSDDEGY
jgi:hypothetical protein